MSVARKFIHAALTSGSLKDWGGFGNIAYLFKNVETKYYDFVDDFVRKHGKLPDIETFEKHTGVDLNLSNEPPTYYHDLLLDRHIELELKSAVKLANEKLGLSDKKPREALQLIADAVAALHIQQHQAQITDFRNAYDIIMPDFIAKVTQGDEIGVRLGWPTLDQMSGGLYPGDIMSIVGRPALGKAQPLTAKVLLASGEFVRMADIKVGDRLASVDGAPSEVYGIFPQGSRPVYRLTFGDGRTVEADGEHLWKVGCKYWDGLRIMTTEDIVRFRSKAKRYADTLWVPLFSGDFGGAKPTIDPYVLGALIGDGGLTKGAVVLTSMDQHIVDRVSKGLPDSHWLVPMSSTTSGKATQYRVSSAYGLKPGAKNLVPDLLDQLGLMGAKSDQKFLPPQVFEWSREDRVALLQGLMDTDGTIGVPKGSAVFSTSSAALAYDVAELVRSLGGKALRHKPKETTHLPCYQVTVILPDRREAFSLPRKRDLVTDYTSHDPNHLRIVSVEPVGEKPCQCIAVSHRSRLYLTDGYTVTHNTWSVLYNALHAWRSQKKVPLVVSMEMNALILHQRLAAMTTHTSMTQVKNAEMSTAKFEVFKNGLVGLKDYPVPFWVVDANMAASVDDIEMMARMLKPDIILIDGAYLLSASEERDIYKRVAVAANQVKQKLAKRAPVVCSWQFSRQANQKKKDEKVTVDDIGYSDVIGQVSSVILGLFQDESVETQMRRKYRVLKGRNGEEGEFSTNWLFDEMNFDEVSDDVTKLNFS